MCKALREKTLKEVSVNNTKIVDNIIKYINNKLNINLYKDINIDSNNIINNSNDIKKTKSFYKQTIKRLFNMVERDTLREKFLFEEVEKGQKILEAKKSLTVKSPAISDGIHSSKPGNSQEKILLAIGEEIKKQEQRIKKYDDYSKSLEEAKHILKEFIELSPNVTGVEVTIRHYIYGERFCDIANKLCHSNIYTPYYRLVDDLALILLLSL